MIGRNLRNRWVSVGLDVNPGVTSEALAAFESKYHVSLPADLRDYFLAVNGMADGVSDDALIRFWSLNEVKPITEGAPDYSDPSYSEDAASLFLFADFCIWSHAYAIRLSADGDGPNPVLAIGGEKPEKVFASFSELVSSYLRDPDRLLAHLNETA